MKKVVILFILFISIFFISTCNDDGPIDTHQSYKDILVANTWQVKKVLNYSINENQPVDVTNQFPLLYMTFKNDGTYITSIQNGVWIFDETKKQIIFDQNTKNETTAEVVTINASILQLKMYYPITSPPQLLEISFVPTNQNFNTSAVANFDTLWSEFDRRYSFFTIKNIDWDNLYSVYKPNISDTISDYRLFQIMAELLGNLKDGHVNLITPFASYYYTDWYSKYPTNFLGEQEITKYLSIDYGTLAEGYIRFGKIENNIGYIYIGPHLLGDANLWSEGIDAIIDSLWDMKGIIVDIRGNGGGSDALGNIVAGRFADKTRVYSYTRWRNGSDHNDFSDYEPHSILPQGTKQYLKSVALLTNRHCFSSAEGTVLMFRVLPNVTIIGDTTGGGSANPISLQLPNGWSYRVSRWIQYTADKQIFEGKGIAPDLPVTITTKDSLAGRDVILEKAIDFLQQ